MRASRILLSSSKALENSNSPPVVSMAANYSMEASIIIIIDGVFALYILILIWYSDFQNYYIPTSNMNQAFSVLQERISWIFCSIKLASMSRVLKSGRIRPTFGSSFLISLSFSISVSIFFLENKLTDIEPKIWEYFLPDWFGVYMLKFVFAVFSSSSNLGFVGVCIILYASISNFLCRLSCASFLEIVEFQWFLMALSVRPGKYLEINAHLFPNLQFGYIILLVILNNFPILLFSPFLLFNIGIQMIMPSFSTLLSHASFQFLSYCTPVFSATLIYQLYELLILLFGLN